MTALVSWLGVDSRGPTSIYIAADSRLSLAIGGQWDQGRKVFSCMRKPEIFGFYGDVLAVTQALSQLTTLIDLGFVVSPNMTAYAKATAVAEFLRTTVPSSGRGADSSVLYATRVGENMASTFSAWEIDHATGWAPRKLVLPNESSVIAACGSGAAAVKEKFVAWSQTNAERTSRAVFSAFCEAVRSGEDSATGGAPQLAGIYRREDSRILGVIFQGRRYVNGVCVSSGDGLKTIEWRNELFEICDAETMMISKGAKPNRR